ncbi:MAG: cell division FtsZ family protein [SAR324 cluster bacterium]|nr:cell division FtsZ family protein [SAR324 cluster bacterium]
MNLSNNSKQSENDVPVIKIVGVGDGALKHIHRMAHVMDKNAVEFIISNVKQHQEIPKSTRLQHEVIRFPEEKVLIREKLSGSDLVFIVANLGGPDTAAAPEIARIAKETAALTIGVVTIPLVSEATREKAESELEQITKCVNTTIVVDKNGLLNSGDQAVYEAESLTLADEMIGQTVRCFSFLSSKEKMINVDFRDIKILMENGGKGLIGYGAASGENRAIESAKKAIGSPFLKKQKFSEVRAILVSVVGDNSLKMSEVNESAAFIQENAHEEATIIWGVSIDPNLEDQFQTTAIAADFRND